MTIYFAPGSGETDPAYNAQSSAAITFPLEAKFDLNLTKRIYFGKQSLLLGVRIMNLFNNRWLTPFSSQDDLRDWVERNITPDMLKPGEDPLNPRASYKFNYFTTYRNVPREIYFTIGFGF